MQQLLDRPTYLYAELDRLVGLRAGTARRWINGYERSSKRYDPILRDRRQETEWVTWGEMVEARMLSEFRDANVPTARLRQAIVRLRRDFGLNYPLAHLRPHLAADLGELTIKADGHDSDGEGSLVVRTGQLILAAGKGIIDTATLAADSSGEKFAAEIAPDPEYPGIRMNPDRLSGQPTFEGRRVAVATIAGLASAGEQPADIASDYSLSLAQVGAAVGYTNKHKLTA